MLRQRLTIGDDIEEEEKRERERKRTREKRI